MRTDEDLIQSVGARIKQLRYAAGYTQAKMAERLGVSLRNYQRLEDGATNLSLRSLARVARALGIDASQFFVEEPSEKDA